MLSLWQQMITEDDESALQASLGDYFSQAMATIYWGLSQASFVQIILPRTVVNEQMRLVTGSQASSTPRKTRWGFLKMVSVCYLLG